MTGLDDPTRRALSGWLRGAQCDARQPSLSAAVARDGQLDAGRGRRVRRRPAGRSAREPRHGIPGRLGDQDVRGRRGVAARGRRPGGSGRPGLAARDRCARGRRDGRPAAQPHLRVLAKGRDRWRRWESCREPAPGRRWWRRARRDGSGRDASTTTPTSGMPCSAACSKRSRAPRGTRSSPASCCLPWECAALSAQRPRGRPRAGACTPMPRCCTTSRSRTTWRWGRRASCGRRPATWRCGGRFSSVQSTGRSTPLARADA